MDSVDREGGVAVDVFCKAIEEDVDNVSVDRTSVEQVSNNNKIKI